MRSWFLYIPAGLIEIILIWNINLLPLIGLEILPWTKILTWSTDIRTPRTLFAPGRLRLRGHKNIKGLYQNHMHIFIPFRKFCKVSKQLKENCKRTLIAFHVKKEKVHKAEKVREKLRTRPKPDTQLQSRQKASAKFQNNRWKTVWGVAPTRYPLTLIVFHVK